MLASQSKIHHSLWGFVSLAAKPSLKRLRSETPHNFASPFECTSLTPSITINLTALTIWGQCPWMKSTPCFDTPRGSADCWATIIGILLIFFFVEFISFPPNCSIMSLSILSKYRSVPKKNKHYILSLVCTVKLVNHCFKVLICTIPNFIHHYHVSLCTLEKYHSNMYYFMDLNRLPLA